MPLPVGAEPGGTWKPEIKDSAATPQLFSGQAVTNIPFFVTWQALSPPWPQW